MKNKITRSLLGFLSFALTLVPFLAYSASENWVDFISASGIYESRMPQGASTTTTDFLIADQRALRSEETSVVIDQRPYKDAMKSYVIKFDQSFGPPLTVDDIARLVQQDFNAYAEHYKDLEGVVRNKSTEGFGAQLGGEIQISYRDPTFGIQSIRVRILYDDTTKIQQIVVGPDDIMNSYSTRDFYESLHFNPGIAIVERTMLEDWKSLESPTGMFTMRYPKFKAPPYYTTEPTAKWDDKNEIVSLAFHDPVRNEKLFFNIYGYQFNADMDFAGAQEVLIKRHILKQRGTQNGVKFKKGMDGTGFPYIETAYAITPMPAFPYIRTVKLKAFFAGKTMLVQETLTSGPLLMSNFATELSHMVMYQPDKIHAPVQPEISSLAPAPAKTSIDGATEIIEKIIVEPSKPQTKSAPAGQGEAPKSPAPADDKN